MAGKVFISCGQATAEECDIAKKIEDWLKSKGFTSFRATGIQTILELNTKIISELKKSDFYLFINFKREQVCGKDGFRGSLYTHQELAIALALRMEKILLINHKDVIKEGIAGYLVSNVGEFSEYNEVLNIVQEAVEKAGWDHSYSRNLSVNGECSWTGPEYYTDHVSGTRLVRILHAEIHNCRPDIAALDFSARLIEIEHNGKKRPSHDKTPLKISGQMGYSTSIWPKSSCTLDLLSAEIPPENCTFPTSVSGVQSRPTRGDGTNVAEYVHISASENFNVYLNSASDIYPRSPIISEAGTYSLRYEAFSTGFNPIYFIVELRLPQCEAKIVEWNVK